MPSPPQRIWRTGRLRPRTLTGGDAGGSFSTPITVYDSLGNSHVLTFNFTETSSGNWTYQITIPAADVGSTGNPQVVASGTDAVQLVREFDFTLGRCDGD